VYVDILQQLAKPLMAFRAVVPPVHGRIKKNTNQF